MARSQSKYQSILSKARERVDIARENVEVAENNLGLARAAFNAHQMAYNSLEKELTPTPRKKSTPKPATAPKDKPETKAQASNGALCIAKVPGLDVVCDSAEDYPIHDPNAGYGGYHPFQSSAPVVAKRSGRKSASTSSIPSSETEKESVSAVGASAGD